MNTQRYPLHVLVFGFTGTGKSSFAATFPTPGYVVNFDGRGKAAPFLRTGDQVENTESPNGVPIQLVKRKGKLLWEIHHHQDLDPEEPDAYALFRQEIRDFDDRKWKTFVFDSLTSAALSAYLEQRFKINKSDESKYNDDKNLKWRSGMTDQLEYQTCRRFVGYECNVIVIAHVEEKAITVPSREGPRKIDKRVEAGVEDEEGNVQVVRTISAPGRLSKRLILPSQFPEVLRAHVVMNGKGKREWRLQSLPDGEWHCGTQIPVPDGCEATYESLWADAERSDP